MMTHSKELGSTITNTRMRTPDNLSPFSGMCSVCTDTCTGTCEIGLSALRGSEAIYPFKTDINQFASEKDYPLDFSHFNIDGKVFGVLGCEEDGDKATFPNVDIGAEFGIKNPVKIKAPIILPAIAKLNWRDYYSGAALAGIPVVIGEGVIGKDPGLVLEKGKVVKSPLIEEMVACFRKYHRGYGDIVLQANYDDDNFGVLEYGIKELGLKSVELKFGQGAKGIQGMGRIEDIEKAIELKEKGFPIIPDPTDPEIAEKYRRGIGRVFEKVDRLPMWNEEILLKRIKALREIGAERICFKTGPFASKDLIKILKIASKGGIDLVTFDGAGGGTGSSPSKMMNEWGMPTVYMESIVYRILEKMQGENYELPQISIAGGFATEDQVFKGLSLAAPHVSMIGIGRAAMTAAMVGKKVGDLLEEGIVPKDFQRFGSTKEEIFQGIRELREYYGDEVDEMSTGAIGLYSYIDRVSTGLRQLMALNRKFSLEHIDRRDIMPLTELSKQVSGLKTYGEILEEELNTI